MATEQTKIGAFWTWFKENSERLKHVRSTEDPEYLEIEKRLGDIGEIQFEIGGSAGSTDLELVFTAHGDVGKFALIDSIAEAAPKLEGWRVYALKPPILENMKVTYEGVSVRTQDLWVKLDSEKSERDVPTLNLGTVDSNASADSESFVQGAMVLLESFFGERAFSSELGKIRFVSLPSDPGGEGFIKLDELARRLNIRRIQ